MKSVARFTFALLLSCGLVPAAWSANDFITNKTITAVTLYSTYAVIKVSPTFANQQGCNTAYSPEYVALDWSADPALKNVLAGVLMASTTGQTIGFAAAGCHAWGGGIVKMYRIDLAP